MRGQVQEPAGGNFPLVLALLPWPRGYQYHFAHNAKLDPTRNVVYGAALALAKQTWEAGQNIETALTAAGYARYVVDGIISYVTSEGGFPDLEPTSQGTSQFIEENMSSSTTVKRARTGSYSKKKSTPVAPTVKKYVKKCMDRLVEDKYHTVAVGYTSFPVAGAVFADTLLIPQSLTDAGRIGNNVRVRGFSVKGFFYGSTADVGRLILAWDKQSNGAAPTVADVLTISGTNAIAAQYNQDTVVGHGGSRFQIITDKVCAIQPEIAATNYFIPYKYNWKGNKVVRYDGVTATITDLVSTNLVILYLSTGATVQSNMSLRVFYQDA